MSFSPLREHLKRATASCHDIVDRDFGAFDLSDDDGYCRFLIAHSVAARACQPAADRFVAGQLDIDSPDYVALLRHDLAAMDVDADSLPTLFAPAGPAGDAGDAGVGYVLLGSRLGAASIRAEVARAHPRARALSGRFLSDRSGIAVWRRFLEWSDRTPFDEGERADMVSAARATFTIFRDAAAMAAKQQANILQ